MPRPSRRDFLQTSAATVTGAASAAFNPLLAMPPVIPARTSNLQIAPFRIDVTAPNGHGCCGGLD